MTSFARDPARETDLQVRKDRLNLATGSLVYTSGWCQASSRDENKAFGHPGSGGAVADGVFWRWGAEVLAHGS